MKVLLPLVLALLGGFQDRTAYNEAYVKLSSYLWEQRLGLGDWCKSNGLNREARGHYQFIVAKIQGAHPYKTKADEKLRGDWKKLPNKAVTSAKWAEYEKKLQEYFKTCGAKAWQVYLAAKKGKLKETDLALEKTVEFYFDQEDARKERNEEKVEGFGWVPKAEAALVNGAVDFTADLGVKNAEHRDWASAWVIKSPHFIVWTTHPWRTACDALKLLEQMYDAFYGTVGARMKAPTARMGLYLFRLDVEAEGVRVKVPGAPGPGFIGFFSEATNVAYVRWLEDGNHTLKHEVTHMLAYNGMEQVVWSTLQCANVCGDSPDNYWIMEGIAEYFATFREEGGKPVIGSKQGEFAAMKPPALRGFLDRDFTLFQADPMYHYPIAYAVTSFLMESSDGKYKSAFLDFLKEYYLGNGGLDVFEKTIGKIPDIEKDFLEWLKK